MTSLWIRVLLLQTLIFLVMVCVGRLFLGLRWRTACLAMALALPTPLFKVSPGAAGLIFSADLVVVFFVFQWAFGVLRARPDCTRSPARFMFLAISILFLLPGMSTFLGYLIFPEANRGLNYVAANTFRQIGYLVVFWAMTKKMQWEERPDRFVILQCLMFGAVAICGLVQYAAKIDLDMWAEIRGLDQVGQTYGGGFMGLYRGAVGAYSIGVVAALTMLILRVRSGMILGPVITIIIFGMMLAVGTRQGVAIGAFAFFLSLVFFVRSLPAGTRFAAFFRATGFLLLVGILALVAVKVVFPAQFDAWIVKRFAGFESLSSIIALVKSRDVYGMSLAVQNLKDNPLMLFFGLGHGTETRTGTIFVKYGDHELLNIWQIGGLPLLLSYIAFLLMLLVRFRRYRFLTDPVSRIYVATAFVVLASSIPLLYGHFFILNAYSGNAPVGYWHWSLFGGALGVLTKPEYMEGRQPEYVMYDASPAFT